MGWREVIAASQYDWDMGIVGGSQPTWAEYRERDLENAVLYETCGNCHAAALLAMPASDRIALARELLPAGAVVAWDVGEELSPEHGEPDSWQWGFYDGWNACRAAMLADPDA